MMQVDENIWILFEERPKSDVIRQILLLVCKDLKLSFIEDNIQIIPVIECNFFQQKYYVKNFKIKNIKHIYLILVSGESSFVDFLVFKSKKIPDHRENLKNCVIGIEETKTDSIESRNTAAGQRGTKFLFLDYFFQISKQTSNCAMLYNNKSHQNNNEASSVVFIKKCFKTLGIKIFGDFSEKYRPFNQIDELIEFKNKMRNPPAGNTPIKIKKYDDRIEISGILSKPADKGNIGHDPNQGQLITIAYTLRKLGWNNDIVITHHKVSQNYLNRNSKNKFIFASKILGIKLSDVSFREINLNEFYWKFENKGEKVASILLHIICNNLNYTTIYENHASSERGYFYTNDREALQIPKKYNGINIRLPDYVFKDPDEKIIYICEGEMYQNYNIGIEQLNGFKLFIEQYLNIYYPEHKIIKSIILSDAVDFHLKDKVLFQLCENGKMIISENAPLKLKGFINGNLN